MWKCARILVLVAGMVTIPACFVSAAPPPSCAYKYIGTWVYPGGTTVVAPGGTAYPKCPFCVATQTWTCSGNTYYFDGVTATLSPNGRKLFSPGIVATRIGGAGQAGDNTSGKTPATSKTKKSVADTQVEQPSNDCGIGFEERPEQCLEDGGGEKSCKCVLMKNSCKYALYAHYVLSNAKPSSVNILGEAKAEVCTTSRGTTFRYLRSERPKY